MSYLQYILTEASADGIKLQMAKSFFYAMKDVDQQELNDFIVEQPWFPRDVSKEVFQAQWQVLDKKTHIPVLGGVVMVDEEEQARFMKEKADVACARAVAVCTSPLVPKQVLLRADSGFFRSESWAFDSRIDFGAAKEQVRGLNLRLCDVWSVTCCRRCVLRWRARKSRACWRW